MKMWKKMGFFSSKFVYYYATEKIKDIFWDNFKG